MQRNLKEQGLEKFMESVPEGTGVGARATFERFLQSLQQGGTSGFQHEKAGGIVF